MKFDDPFHRPTLSLLMLRRSILDITADKSQIPNYKSQISSKFQFQITETISSVLNFGDWSLFVIWCLLFGSLGQAPIKFPFQKFS
jgi:hypothetical protein